MHKNTKDLTDKKFGHVTVLKYSEKQLSKGHVYWHCVCDCGYRYLARGSHLRDKNIRSCGRSNKCQFAYKLKETNLKREKIKQSQLGVNNSFYKHGESSTTFFMIYNGIRGRCNTKSSGNYPIYGGRGIKCLWNSYLEFKNDMYESYIEHVKQFGERQTTIERKNVNGNYCKKNCVWATHKEQANNQRNNTSHTYKGVRKTVKQWSEIKKEISYSTLLTRLKTMSFKKAFEMPRLRKEKTYEKRS